MYRVKFLGAGIRLTGSPAALPKRHSARVRALPHHPARKRVVVKERPRPAKRRVVKRAVVAKKVVKVAAREPFRQSPPNRVEKGTTTMVPEWPSQVDPSLLAEPGYGEEALLASMASVPGGKVGTSGSGWEGERGTGGIIPPLPLANEKPPYPPLARKRGYEGEVVVRLLVSPGGKVDKVVLIRSSGYSILDRVAVRTLRRWRFKPAMKDGSPISYWVEVPVIFSLREAKG